MAPILFGTRLLPANAADAPDFSNGFFYADGDGNLVYDNSIVSVDSGSAPVIRRILFGAHGPFRCRAQRADIADTVVDGPCRSLPRESPEL